MATFRLLGASDIEIKVKKAVREGVELLLYKTARTDMDLLDETFSPENWECDYREIKGNLYCGIGVWDQASLRTVWKWDCGIESRTDADGNQKKGEASDAFKRAGFKWGIGRELYTAPHIFVPASGVNLKEVNGKYRTYDRFAVEKIAYDKQRNISGISVVNANTGKRCFVWTRQVT